MNSTKALHICIMGGGTAGWMAACLLGKRWPQHRITVIESPEIGIIGVGEGSTPQLRAFFETLGIAEAEWMPACNATYKAGISFHGWSNKPGFESYFHPFQTELDHHTVPHFYFHTRARRTGRDVWAHPDRFFLSSQLAKLKLAPIPNENFPFDLGYGSLGPFNRAFRAATGALRKHCAGQSEQRPKTSTTVNRQPCIVQPIPCRSPRMRALILPALTRFLGGLRFRQLFLVSAGLFVLTLLVPDLVPFADELLLGLATLLLARWKTDTAPDSATPGTDGQRPPIDLPPDSIRRG